MLIFLVRHVVTTLIFLKSHPSLKIGSALQTSKIIYFEIHQISLWDSLNICNTDCKLFSKLFEITFNLNEDNGYFWKVENCFVIFSNTAEASFKLQTWRWNVWNFLIKFKKVHFHEAKKKNMFNIIIRIHFNDKIWEIYLKQNQERKKKLAWL